MKKNKNSRGVITVLLIIILIPMLLVTSVFVDASRYKLVKSMVTSTSDLTLNSVIANYDTDLDDMYGLFGTVQNIDEFYEELEEYFKIMLMQSGLDESTSEDTSLFLTNGVKNGDFSNFFEMEFLDDVSIEEVPNGNLANPVILEKQIVDFMKYRSPINTGLSFITALQSFKTIEDQKKVIEAKDEYYKDVSKINKALRNAWKEICYYSNGSYWLEEGEYQYYEYIGLNSAPEKISQADYIKSISKAFKNYRQEYEICNKEFFLNIASNKYYNTDISVKNPSASSQKSEKITQSIADKLYKEINKSIGDFKSALGECKKDMQSDNSFVLDYNPSHGDYPTQVWLKNNYNGRISDFALHYNTLCTHYTAYLNKRAKVAALKTESEKDEELLKKCQDALDSYDCDGEFKSINDVVNDLNTKLNSCRNYYITNYKKSEKEISEDINKINKEIIDIKSDLNTAYTHLDNAVKYLIEAVDLMDADLATKKNNWKQAAEKIDGTTIGQENLSEISGLNDQYINKDTINKFIAYLETIRDNIGDSSGVIKQIENFTFCGKQLGDITANISSPSDPTKMIFTNLIIQKYGSNNLKNMPTTKDEIEAIANEFFARKDVYKESTISTDWLSSDHNPTIGENNYSNNLNFYNYLSNQFGDLSKDTATKVESIDTDTELNNANALGNEPEAEEVTNPEAKADVSSLSVLKNETPFDGGGAEGTDANSKMKNAKLPSSGSLFSDLVNGLERLRDKMYITDYVMSMFSYATIESELAKENEKNNTINSTDPTSSSTNTKDGKVQSLTFQEINADNNKIYPYEAEYIVYGKGTNSANYNATCSSIFGVRFMFNLIYAFTSSQLKTEALPIAAGLSAATLGIVPAEVFKIVILLVDTIVESGIDLYAIKKGESLPLYKTEKTWQTSYVNVAKKAATKVAEEVITKVVEVGTDTLVEYLNKTVDEAGDWTEDKEEKLMEYLYSYFDDQIQNIANGVSEVFFNVYDSVEKTVLMEYGKVTSEARQEIIKKVSNGLDDWAKQDNSEVGIIRNVKSKVVSMLKDLVEKWVDEMLALGKNKIQKTSSQLGDDASKKIDQIAKSMTQVVTDTIDEMKTDIDKYKNQFFEGIKDSISEGGEKLKETINSSVSSYFGNDSGNINVCTNAESLLSFKYSDYLRFFAMCSIYTNEEGFITRISNLIQTNMNIQTAKNSKEFDLNKSKVYLKVSTTVKVKPLLINLDIFNAMIGTEDNGTWGRYDFVTVKGY